MRYFAIIILLAAILGCGGAGSHNPVVGPVKPDAEGTAEYCLRHDYDPQWIEINCGICHWIY